jgi:hypothetical protein
MARRARSLRSTSAWTVAGAASSANRRVPARFGLLSRGPRESRGANDKHLGERKHRYSGSLRRLG